MAETDAAVQENAAVDRIVREAAKLFADKGFKGVTTREIARAVSLNIGTVHYHVGSKRDLYLKVYAWACAEEREAIAASLEEAAEKIDDPPVSLAQRLIDGFVETLAKDTVRIRFIVRHWLDAGQHPESQDVEESLAVFRQADALLAQAQEGGMADKRVDANLFLRGFFGIVYSYFAFGAFSWEFGRGDPHSRENLQSLKRFLEQYVVRMLGVEEP
jgi:AcrR family transcriptional regulator